MYRYLSISMVLLALLLAQQGRAQGVAQDALAEKMLAYQLPCGGWPKQLMDKRAIDYGLPMDAALLKKIAATDDNYACIDNAATTREIATLTKAYGKTANAAYRQAALRGIRYLLRAQYANGGFPQYYPNKALYRAEITFNDNAMINALHILDQVARQQQGFAAYADGALIDSCRQAVQRGVACILATQVRQDGELSIWAAQYDERTLVPAQARKFEPISLSSAESVDIIRFLMRQEATPAIAAAIDAAVNWLAAHDMPGYRFDKVLDAQGRLTRALVADADAVVWSRFYDIQDSRPLFGDRDNSVTYNFADVSEERKNGYAWFGSWPQQLIQTDYPAWQSKNKKYKNKK